MTTRYFFRCKTKGCGHVWAMDYPVEPAARGGDPRRAYPQGPSGFTTPKYDKIRGCPKCHGIFKPSISRINGIYSQGVKCDARCTDAQGVHCTCSCGGARHGQKFVVDQGSADK